MSHRALQPIMIVEDSEDDFEAAERALTRDGVLKNQILHFDSGSVALDYLFRRPPYDDPSSSPRPALVLLDLNMPGIDGRDVLASIKSSSDTCRIPVVVMTTSDDEWDISRCYEAGANTFIKKPVAMDNLFSALKTLKDYWFHVAILPRN